MLFRSIIRVGCGSPQNNVSLALAEDLSGNGRLDLSLGRFMYVLQFGFVPTCQRPEKHPYLRRDCSRFWGRVGRVNPGPMLHHGPQRIVCLTEETTEWLYLLGEERRIVGISGYTVRPPRARQEKPKVSAFLEGKIDRIVALQPEIGRAHV